MDDRDVYEAILDAASAGRQSVLATVIATRGSVPRHAGSKMLIQPGGEMFGTIGGGCGEADVIAAAENVVATGETRVIRVELTDPVDSWSPAVCGGFMDVLIEPISPVRLRRSPASQRPAPPQGGSAESAHREPPVGE